MAAPPPCSFLDPLSDTFLCTALHEEANIAISCARFRAVQTSMLPKHREVAVKWLIQLNYRFKLSSDTVYSSVMLLDLVSMRMPIPKPEIQMYAAACYRLAAKIDTRTPLTIEEFNSVTEQSFNHAEFIQKEVEIMRILAFKLSYATIKFYLRIFLEALKPDESVISLVNFLAEIGLMKFHFLDFRQSAIALASFVLASAGLAFPDVAANAIRISHCGNPVKLIKCVNLLRTDVEAHIKNWHAPADGKLLDLLASAKFPSDLSSLVSAILRRN
jgi:hypothetical protein